MIIKNLKLQNYRRFRQLDLEFPENLIGIVGSNGVGKTTIVEAIGWALYGNRIKRTDKLDIRSQFCSDNEDCSVEMIFTCAGNEYRLLRSLRGRSAIAEAAIYLHGNPEPEAVRETGVSEYVEKLLRLDYKSFFASVFAKQKDLAALSAMQPEERRKSIARMINIDVIDKAREAVRRDRNEKTGYLEVAQAGLKKEAELKARQEQFREQLSKTTEVEQKSVTLLEETKQQLDASKKTFEAMSQLRDQYQKLSAEIEKWQSRKMDFEKRAQDQAKEIANIKRAQAKLEKLRPKLKGFSNIKKEKERLDGEASKKATLDAKLAEKTRLMGLYQRETVRLTKLDAELKSLVNVQEQVEKVTQELSHLETQRESLRQQLTKVQGQKEKVIEQGKDIRGKKEQVTAMGSDSPCPVCTRPLGGHYDEVVQHFEQELVQLRAQYQNFTKQEQELSQRIRQTDETIKVTREKRDGLLQAQQQFQERESQRKNMQESINEFNQQLKNVIDEIKQIGSVHYDSLLHKNITQQFEQLTILYEQALKYEEHVKRLPKEQAELSHIQKTIDDMAKDIAEKQEEREALNFDEARYLKLKEDVETRQAEYDRAKDELNRIQNEIKLIQKDLERVAGEIEEQKQLRKKIKKLEEEKVYLKALDEHFWNFRQELASRMRPLIAHRASELLRLTTNGRYSLIELDEDYNIFIYDENQRFPIARFSGGEQDLANLCLRIAISQVVAERAGVTQVNFIVLDEVFGSQDEERKELILNALQHLSSQFRQIFVITHVEGIKDTLPIVVAVEEKDFGESVASIT